MANTLRKEIGDWLNWRLGEYSHARRLLDAEDLADRLKRNGYCSEPYSAYESALCCPINKRREKECLMVYCPNNTFCRLLRREGYIK